MAAGEVFADVEALLKALEEKVQSMDERLVSAELNVAGHERQISRVAAAGIELAAGLDRPGAAENFAHVFDGPDREPDPAVRPGTLVLSGRLLEDLVTVAATAQTRNGPAPARAANRLLKELQRGGFIR